MSNIHKNRYRKEFSKNNHLEIEKKVTVYIGTQKYFCQKIKKKILLRGLASHPITIGPI